MSAVVKPILVVDDNSESDLYTGSGSQPSHHKPAKKLDSKILTNFDDPNYDDVEEAEDSRGSGIKILPLLLKISKRCRKKNDPKRTDRVRCIGSSGCGTTWSFP